MAVSHKCRYFLILILGLFCFDLFAQTAEISPDADVKQQIRDIKLDDSYIKAEADDSITDQAYKVAVMQIMLDLKSDNEEIGLDSLLLERLKPSLQTLVYTRGSIKRVFVYIEFEEAYSIFKKTEREFAENANVPAIDRTPSIVMVMDDPEDSESEKDTDDREDPDDHSADDDSDIEESDVEEQPSRRNTSASAEGASTPASYTDLILLLNGIEMADEAVKVLQEFKSNGKVKEIGQLRSGMQIPSGAILIIYNRQHQLQALLSQEESGDGTQYYNLKRDCSDSLANYSGCGILWFR